MISLRGTFCFHISTINSVMQKHYCFKFFLPSQQRTDFHEFGRQLIYFWSLGTDERLTLYYKQ